LQPASKSLLLSIESWSPDYHIYLSTSSHPKETALPVSHTLSWDGNDFDVQSIATSSNGWLQKWKQEEQRFFKRKGTAFAAQPVLTDGHVYEQLSVQIPGHWSLFFSNSFPARDRSLFGKWADQLAYTNRGASGIDGITSTALGIGIGTQKPVMLFTGDLAFLHDTNALLNQKLLKQPLVIAVINNQGGSIFRMLPIANYENYFTHYFETPQQAHFGKLAASYDLPFKCIHSLDELEDFELSKFIGQSEAGENLHIIEFQTDPESSMDLRRQLWRNT
jgi:2-succinyl-5-enolpyruvyl-6-hydroxy-3-cyclohexene-1-carboxylate synthase